MNVYMCLALCCLPFVLCFVFFKMFSSVKISTELFAGLFGLLAVLPITFLQFLITGVVLKQSISSVSGILPLFLKTVFFNGLIEECVKMMCMLLIPRKKLTFSQFFMAALLCGLCLGCFESVVYFLQYLQSANERGARLLYHLIFARIFSSDIIHTFCAGLCGIFIWSCISKQIDVWALIFAVLSHGIFNFFASFQSNIKWFSVVVILFLFVETRIHYEKNKPAETYKKDPVPAKTSKDVTIESALKDAPAYNPENK